MSRHAGWLWAGAGLIAGLVIENNVHSHACATVVTTVVETCSGSHHKPKPKKRCR